MKKALFIILCLVQAINGIGQVTDAEKQLKTYSSDTTLGWNRGGIINISTSQTSLTNWAAGGQSSVSVNGLLSEYAHNKKAKSLWENYMDLAYGTMKQKGSDWWKTDDRLDFTSKYGIKATDKVYYAALLNFKTQLTDGFNYPNDSVKISGFMSPGYLLLAIGVDYIPGENFTIFFSPLTYKLTMVKDNALADAGAFGVEPGENTKSEFGGYFRVFLKRDLMENIAIQTKLDLFTNYLEDFGSFDVSWETLLSMKVNEFFAATLSTHLLYDQDIAVVKNNDDGEPETYYSRVQFKEVLSVGFSVKF